MMEIADLIQKLFLKGVPRGVSVGDYCDSATADIHENGGELRYKLGKTSYRMVVEKTEMGIVGD